MGSCQSTSRLPPAEPRTPASGASTAASTSASSYSAPSAEQPPPNSGAAAASNAASAAPEARRRQQELSDEAFARQLVMEELASLGGPSAPGFQAPRRTARATCPFCEAQNEYVLTNEPGPVTLRCGGCGGHFQAPRPPQAAAAALEPGGGQHPRLGTSFCRSCGALNQFPAPGPGDPVPDVLCGICGTVAPASASIARPHRTAGPQSRLSEQVFRGGAAEGLMRMNGGPMVRVNVGGQRRVVPLMLLLALMAEESESGNPAQASDIDALPTRKLDGTGTLGEQNKCLICLEEFGDGDEVKTLPCLHFYHQRCIEQWLGTDNSCPVCKTPIGQAALNR